MVRLLHQEGRRPLWVQVQGLSRHGGSCDTSLLVASICLRKWEAGSSPEHEEGEAGWEI